MTLVTRAPTPQDGATLASLLTRRLLQAVPVLAGVVLATFGLLHLIPGDPARVMLGNRATDPAVAALRQQWGLDRPWWVQLGRFVSQVLLHADTGRSLFYDVPTRSLVLPRLGLTLGLVALAAVFAVVLSVPLAAWAALRRERAADHVIRLLTTAGAGLPTLWVGLMLVVLFSVRLRWFPVGGAGPGLVATLHGLVLPAFAAALGIVPVVVRSLRASLLEVLDADYIASARARSLGETRVLAVHAVRNAVVPATTLLGLNVAYLVGGTVVVEQVFALDGLGDLLLQSISNRDFPVVQGVALVLAVLVVVVTLVTDLITYWIDARVGERP